MRAVMKRYWVIGLLVLGLTGFVAVWVFRGSGDAVEMPNVLLISIDTCRADHLSCYGYEAETTPNIDAVAAEGILFENTISPVPITLPSHSSMLTGTIPPFHGVHDNHAHLPDEGNVSLAEVLRDAGYTTGGIISAYVLDSYFGIDQGFDSYHDEFKSPLEGNMNVQRRGEETTDIALDWLEENKEGAFFLFLHYYDPHMNYEPPEPFASRFAPSLYAGEIAYTDYCIGQVVKKLKDLNLYDSTLIIVTADHGQMLGEHGEGGHTYFIYQSAIKVPLIFKLPGQCQSARIESIAGLVDIVPTVCSLLNIRAPGNIQGVDLSPSFHTQNSSQSDRHVFCESLEATKYGGNSLLGVVNDRFKYIQTTRPELYDVIEDPGELDNLFENEQERASVMRGKLAQVLEESSRIDNRGSAAEMDPQAIQRLESLGYVEGAVNEDFSFDQTKPDPKDLLAYHVLHAQINSYLHTKQYDKAEMWAEQLTREGPDCSIGYEKLGSMALKRKDYAKAITSFERAIEINPSNAKTYNERATAYLRKREYDKAIRDLEKAIELSPRLIGAYNNRGLSYLRKGEPSKALDDFARVVELNPKDLFARKHMGWAHMRLGQSNEAVRHFKKALEMQYDAPWVLTDLAWILATDEDAKVRDGAQAVQYAERAGQLLEYKFPRNFITLAAARAETGRFDQAIADSQKALELARDTADEELAVIIEDHLRSYQSKRPWRERGGLE